MGELVAQHATVVIVKLFNAIDISWVLGDQCTLLQERDLVFKAVLISKFLNVLENLFLGDALERVLDPVLRSAPIINSRAGHSLSRNVVRESRQTLLLVAPVYKHGPLACRECGRNRSAFGAGRQLDTIEGQCLRIRTQDRSSRLNRGPPCCSEGGVKATRNWHARWRGRELGGATVQSRARE
jgi:hypothetical protein